MNVTIRKKKKVLISRSGAVGALVPSPQKTEEAVPEVMAETVAEETAENVTKEEAETAIVTVKVAETEEVVKRKGSPLLNTPSILLLSLSVEDFFLRGYQPKKIEEA